MRIPGRPHSQGVQRDAHEVAVHEPDERAAFAVETRIYELPLRAILEGQDFIVLPVVELDVGVIGSDEMQASMGLAGDEDRVQHALCRPAMS